MCRAGGTVGIGAPLTHVPPPISAPFGSATYVEEHGIRAIDVGAPADPPSEAAYLDGVQRYAVEGRLGLVPIVRGYVAAAVMRREGDMLRVAHSMSEEFIVASLERLTSDQRAALEDVGLPLYGCAERERSHPVLDVQLAAVVVQERRERAERRLALERMAAAPHGWLVVDGAITELAPTLDRPANVLGLIKSHETQFLQGHDLETALTLPSGHRSSVFARAAGERCEAHTWYLRLWPWEDRDLLYGLVRIERAPAARNVADATTVSRWILAERAPLAAPDGRWDRLIYPIHQVETYLRAQAGGWW